MNESFVRDRISVLRIKKGVSEYKMSLDLGHSKGYIQSISSGKSCPSMTEFFYICDYLGVTPKMFFDEQLETPQLLQQLHTLAERLSDKDLEVLLCVAQRLNDKTENNTQHDKTKGGF